MSRACLRSTARRELRSARADALGAEVSFTTSFTIARSALTGEKSKQTTSVVVISHSQ